MYGWGRVLRLPPFLDVVQEFAQDLGHACAGRSGDRERRSAYRPSERGQPFLESCSRYDVDLVEGDDLGLVDQARAIGVELAANGLVGAGEVLASPVDEVEKNPRALH